MSFWRCLQIVSFFVNVTAFTTTSIRTISSKRNTNNIILNGGQNTFVVRPLFLSADADANAADGLVNGDEPHDTSSVQTTTSTIAVNEKESAVEDKVNDNHNSSNKDDDDDDEKVTHPKDIALDYLSSPEQSSPPLVFSKYLTMQSKRINVTIRYTGNAGLRPFFLTVAKYIKTSNPDVIIERNILPSVEGSEDATTTFEVIVDGKIIVGKDKMKRQNISASSTSSSDESSSPSTSTNGDSISSDSNNLANGMSVFISMHEISLAISKARKKRRPNTMYLSDEDYDVFGGGGGTSPRAMKLEMLKRSQESNKGQRPLEQ